MLERLAQSVIDGTVQLLHLGGVICGDGHAHVGELPDCGRVAARQGEHPQTVRPGNRGGQDGGARAAGGRDHPQHVSGPAVTMDLLGEDHVWGRVVGHGRNEAGCADQAYGR